MKTLRLNNPYLILVAGITGAGKTTFAFKFSRLFNLPLISGYSHEVSQKIFIEIAKTKSTLVVDANSMQKQQRESFYKLAKHFGYKVITVWTQTDLASAAKRKKVTVGDYSKIYPKFTQPTVSEKYIVISGKHTFASQSKVLLAKLIEDKIKTPNHKLNIPIRKLEG